MLDRKEVTDLSYGGSRAAEVGENRKIKIDLF
jgi:hypothetical protein